MSAPDLSLSLQTERLLLRCHRLDDVDDLLRFHSDPDVVRFVPWPVRDRAMVEETLRTKITQGRSPAPGEWLVLAVERRDTGRVIGEVLLKWASEADRQGEIGFAFAGDQQGQGFAREAAEEIIRLGFEDFGLHRLTAVCVDGNDASARLLTRLGFTQEARLVDNLVFKGEWTTQLVFAMTEETWRSGVVGHRLRDLDEIHALVDVFFDAFTSGEGVEGRIEPLRLAMLDGARIVRTCGLPPTSYDVSGFLRPRQVMLSDGSLTDFSEHRTTGRVDVFGDIAHWFGGYRKSGRHLGEDASGEGMKSIQFVRTTDGWRISGAAWDDRRDDLPIDHLSWESTPRHV